MKSPTTLTIFVIDANDLSRHRLCEELRSFGWHAAGFTPMQICRNAPSATADCLVLDVAHASTAVQVLAALHLRDVATPVIAVTGEIDAELIVRTRSRSVKAVVRKPFDTETLCTTILQVVGGRAVTTSA